jgi:hypothetical protein
MTESELRIGNYLFADVGLPSYQAHKLYKGDIIDLLHGKLEGKIFPIPLTEEWLLKFGFVKTPLTYDKDKLCISIRGVQYDKGRTYFNSWTILEHQPEYVHQLQNLYFALTGEELTTIQNHSK